MRCYSLILAGMVAASPLGAVTITGNFATDPLQNGWQVFGDTNLFQWDASHQRLAVTWDSSKTNSYFYHPLGTILARDDDFQIEFDLQLSDFAGGSEPGKTGGMELGIGFHNLAGATSPGFRRGVYGGAPDTVGFNFFVPGYYEGYGDVPATTTPTFISSSGYSFAPALFIPYIHELPTNQLVHISMTYTATNQTLVTLVTAGGSPLVDLPDVVLNVSTNSGFADTDDYRVDMFSISSYSSVGNPFDSLLAHGIVSNIVVTVPALPVQNLAGALSNTVWRASFANRTNWLYTLQRTEDFVGWTNVSPVTPGVVGTLMLSDTNRPSAKAFYRVKAARP